MKLRAGAFCQSLRKQNKPERHPNGDVCLDTGLHVTREAVSCNNAPLFAYLSDTYEE